MESIVIERSLILKIKYKWISLNGESFVLNKLDCKKKFLNSHEVGLVFSLKPVYFWGDKSYHREDSFLGL